MKNATKSFGSFLYDENAIEFVNLLNGSIESGLIVRRTRVYGHAHVEEAIFWLSA